MKFTKAILATTALVSVAWAGAAVAQANDPSAAGAPQASTPTKAQAGGGVAEIGEVVVTARRRAEVLSRVPVAVTAFDTQTLTNKQVNNTLDLVKLTPGLNFQVNVTRTSPLIAIRGQGRATSGGGTPGVIVYMNDVPLPTYGTMIPTFDLGDVQVLKGPQGTLFGRNTIGGAVLLNTVAPTYKFGGYIEGAYQRFNGKRIEGALNIPIIQDHLAVRLAGQYDYSGSYTKTIYYTQSSVDAAGVAHPGVPTTGRPADQYSVKSFRASVLAEPVTGVRNITVFDWTQPKGTPNAYVTQLNNPPFIFLFPQSTLAGIFGPAFAGQITNLLQCPSGDVSCNMNTALANQRQDRRLNYRNSSTANDFKLWGLSNTTTVDLTPRVTLKNIVGYRHIKSFGNADLDGTPSIYIDSSAINNFRILTEELQLAGNLTDQLKFVVGGFYYSTKPTGRGGQESIDVSLFGGFTNTTQLSYLEERSKAIYGQVDYDLSALVNGLSLTAGYRQTHDQAKGCIANLSWVPFANNRINTFDWLPSYDECKRGTFTTPLPTGSFGANSANYNVKFKKGTYTLSANWQATQDTLLYLAHRRGYRGGGFNFGNVPAPPFDRALQFYGPETLTDFELGLKTHFQAGDMRGAFNGALFSGKDKGFQYQNGTTGACSPPGSQICLPTSGLILNTADLRIKGFEADATLAYGGLTLTGNVAYTKPKVLKVIVPTALAAAYALAGLPPSIADVQISNTPRWQLNGGVAYEAPGDILGGTLSANLDVHHQTSYRSGLVLVPSWTTADAQLRLNGVTGKPVEVRLFVRNLFNTHYYSGGASTGPTGVTSFVNAPPRMYGVAVRYRFGE